MYRQILRCSAAVAVAIGASAAASSLFAVTEPGLWEVARNGAEPLRLCVADTKTLAQFEHRSSKCARTIVRDSRSEAVIHYTCPGSDFGQTTVTLLTPRSLRLQTQGISGGAPFRYLIQARRVGNCPIH